MSSDFLNWLLGANSRQSSRGRGCVLIRKITYRIFDFVRRGTQEIHETSTTMCTDTNMLDDAFDLSYFLFMTSVSRWPIVNHAQFPRYVADRTTAIQHSGNQITKASRYFESLDNTNYILEEEQGIESATHSIIGQASRERNAKLQLIVFMNESANISEPPHTTDQV